MFVPPASVCPTSLITPYWTVNKTLNIQKFDDNLNVVGNIMTRTYCPNNQADINQIVKSYFNSENLAKQMTSIKNLAGTVCHWYTGSGRRCWRRVGCFSDESTDD